MNECGWAKYSHNRGGVLIPQLFSSTAYSLFENFWSMFQHTWHLYGLLGDHLDRLDPDRRGRWGQGHEHDLHRSYSIR